MTKKVRLQDVVQKKTGLRRGPFGGAIKKVFFVESGYKVYEQKNAIYKNTDLGKYYIDEKKFDELKTFEVLPGDFILSCSGTIGEIYQIPNEAPQGVINQALLRIRLDEEKIIPGYFLQLFRSAPVRAKIIDNSRGGAMQNLVSMAEFRKLTFDIPSLEQQRKIAQILSTWDEAIEALEELTEKKKKLFRTLLFTNLRTKSEANYKIKDIGKVKHGKSQKEVEHISGQYPILATGGVIGYASKYLTDKPSVLIGRKGTIDKPGYIEKPFWHVDTLFRIESKTDLVIPKWLYFYFLTINWQAYNQGAVLPSLTGSTIESIKLFVPDLATQQDHVSMLNGLENQIELLVKKKELLHLQKKGLMQQLLTGKTKLN